MISGKPPFNGENHIDLLRNIQRKAVRLPPDVRVSKACVNLLRLLLNRNPLSRAGFKEFFEACDAFVLLGCEGIGAKDTAGSCRIPGTNDLGTIPENDNGNGSNSGSGTDSPCSAGTPPPETSILPVATTAQQQLRLPDQASLTGMERQSSRTYTAEDEHTLRAKVPETAAGPVSTPSSLVPNPSPFESRSLPIGATSGSRNRLLPLTQSPPTSGQFYHGSRVPLSFPSLGAPAMNPNSSTSSGLIHNISTSQSQTSTGDDSGFVMVEHGACLGTPSSTSCTR